MKTIEYFVFMGTFKKFLITKFSYKLYLHLITKYDGKNVTDSVFHLVYTHAFNYNDK